MTPMLEKVAAAIWAEAGFAKLHPEGFAGRPQQVRERYLRDAIAAVRALREPDDETLEAGIEAKMRLYERLEAEGKNTRTMVVADHPAGTIYQAMIDSILADTGDGE